ncbi:MAG: PepSY domain-containing protein [Nocardioides sp.]
MLRPILFLHRWLGVVVGLVMTLWCLSGFVMMYADYPRLLPADQLQGLAPLQLATAERLQAVPLPDDQPLTSARIEMLAGRLVLRVIRAHDPGRPIAQMRATPTAFDLVTGHAIETVPKADVATAARTFAAHTGVAGPLEALVLTPMDQWTVQAYRQNAPLYRADFADPAGTELYVSGKSGEVVQRTTRFQRFWGWLGAVPHWLYPTMLRQNGELWSQVVIWTSLAGCFLTVTGLWTGIARLRRRPGGTIGSPFRGIWWWHHVFGLFFGLLTVTWIASGLFSMNPWGFLNSMAGFAERQTLAGTIRWSQARAALAALPEAPAGTVRLETAPLNGQVHLVAIARDGRLNRFSQTGSTAPLRRDELRQALAAHFQLGSLVLLREEDSYYYAHRSPAPLPVWRAVLTDSEQTQLYIDPVSGQLVRAFDRNGRAFRWLQDGLHSLDFPALRKHPVRDIVVLPLLALVTLVCVTGTWMGLTKIRRDVRRMKRRRPLPKPSAQPAE